MPIKDETQQPSSGHQQHPIPQNVMDVEFKVVGDLTVRQLMYLFAGGSFAYIIYKSELPIFWRLIIVFISVVGTVAVAFVPYEERGLDKWFMSFLKAMTAPTQMVWRKTYSPPAYFLSDYANIIKNEIITLTPAKSRNKLDDYLGQLSETENELDKTEAIRLQNIRQGFSTQANVSVVMERTTTQSYSPSLGTTTTTETDVTFIEDTAPGRSFSESPEPQKTQPQQSQPAPKPVQQQKPVQPQSQPQQQPTRPPEQRPQPSLQPQRPQVQIQKQVSQPKPVDQERKDLIKEIVKEEISSKKELLNSIELKQPTLQGPSIDRAIINIPSNPKGEIKISTTTKLPKTIVVQDIKEIETKESSLERKVAELLEVTKQVRADMQAAADKEAHISQNQSRIEFFNTKYRELEKEQAKITTQLTESTTQVQQIGSDENKELSKQVKDLTSKNEELRAQLEQIQAEIAALKGGVPQAQVQEEKSTPHPTQQERSAEDTETEYGDNQSLSHATLTDKQTKAAPTTNSNIISGVVKNKSGELIENAVVIIKDKDGDAIRALKTNQLGQFKTQTPMQNGKYSVEVIKGGMKFDIISVDAKGDVISPLYIVAYE